VLDNAAYVVRTLVENPHEANRLLADSQMWHDEPGRWLGNLLPDLGLSAVTAGAGTVSRLSRAARVARVADVDVPTVPSAVRPRVFTSKDPLVGELATWLDEWSPGIVKGVNVDVPTRYGRWQEVDIDLDEYVVEVKSGRAQKLRAQLDAIAEKTGRKVVAFVPEMPGRAWAELARQGYRLARDPEELAQILLEGV